MANAHKENKQAAHSIDFDPNRKNSSATKESKTPNNITDDKMHNGKNTKLSSENKFDLDNAKGGKDKGSVLISYNLRPRDIFLLVFKIHGILLVLPITFLMGYILLAIVDPSSLESFITLTLFLLATLGIVYIYLRHYYIFKKQHYFYNRNTDYFAELSDAGIAVYQNKEENFTEYDWRNFFRCKETKSTYYFYFRYDRALIVKKHQFVKGDAVTARSILKENFPHFKPRKK